MNSGMGDCGTVGQGTLAWGTAGEETPEAKWPGQNIPYFLK